MTDKDKISQFGEMLEGILESQPKSRIRQTTLREAITTHRATIEQIIAKGHSRTSVARMIRESGIVSASVETIRTCLLEVLGPIEAPAQRATSPRPKKTQASSKKVGPRVRVATPAASKADTTPAPSHPPTEPAGTQETNQPDPPDGFVRTNRKDV